MPTRLVLIRHAPIASGTRLCGSFDVPLSSAGLARLHGVLRGQPTRPAPDALYTSSLMRARQVAGPLGQAWSLEPWIADWAREIDCGRVEGMKLDELQREFPQLWARNGAQDDNEFAWPGGESYRRFRERVLAGLRNVAAAYPGQRVAVVTHAGVITQVLGAIHGRRPAVWGADRPDPLTATEVMWANGGPAEVLTYNDPNWF